ncbi:hypothetical protein [Halobaculum sp. EA56]|uniref:hypothetical protein n=1 Tax=Halobaculum sp. EA56 TaxID=3421648 RepID=UPI003EBA9177
MNRLVRALLAVSIAPPVVLATFVLFPDPTGGVAIVVGAVASLVAVPAAYLALGGGGTDGEADDGGE